MFFRIPQLSDSPSYAAQAVPDFCDFAVMAAQGGGNGVVSGFEISILNFTSTVAPGTATFGEQQFYSAGGGVTHAAANTAIILNVFLFDAGNTAAAADLHEYVL